MFHHQFPARPHLLLRPEHTQNEVETATSQHDPLEVYARVADALGAALGARPQEAKRISSELAQLLRAILRRSRRASKLDRFGLFPYLSALPRVIVAMTYVHFLCDDFVRKTITVDAPLPR